MRQSRLSILAAAWLIAATAAPALAELEVTVTPDRGDWLYEVAEPVVFTIQVQKDGEPVENDEVHWRVGPEKMDPFAEGTAVLDGGRAEVRAHGLDRPGFLNCFAECEIGGESARGLATAAFEPEGIRPTTPEPDDFMEYWADELAEMRESDLDIQMEKLEEQSDDTVDAYHISYNVSGPGWGVNRFYGMLADPKGEGPFPAVLRVPGAGIRPYSPDTGPAREGIVTLSVGIHGIPVNLPDRLYDSLRGGALSNYWEINLEDRDRYYYNRVIKGCVRAVDFLLEAAPVDETRLAVFGGSQGGALSIIAAALEPRIDWAVSLYPALCDHYGYLHGRAGGWPHLLLGHKPFNLREDKLTTMPYYDVVNFARNLKCPIIMAMGYNDTTCPPTSMFSAYNVIESKKTLHIVPRLGHQYSDEFVDPCMAWLMERLK